MSSPKLEEVSLDENVAFELKLKEKNVTNSELDKIENELAEELKLCCEEGKETNVQKSAMILRKLGLVYYRRSPDMFSLIRSAVLYNAALVRNSQNKQDIQNDLEQLCFEILSLAGSKSEAKQLIMQANIVKEAALEMRKKVSQSLSKIESIPESANSKEMLSHETKKILSCLEMQNQVTYDYKQIMVNLARFCEEVMGEPPCKFALVGMGSIARREITPFSDFENIILLDNKVDRKTCYEEKLQYFRWFSVIFQIVLINLQETIVPSVAIASLNNWFYDSITLRGISFDGMMPHACKFPLGRQQHTKEKPFTTELIKPVDDMLKYLSTEENLKNGYHLSDILTKTCFVYKSKDIFDEFEKGVYEIIESEHNQTNILEDVKNQVINDLQSFATRFSLSKLKSNENFNVKRVVYRSTTLFISALGRICNVRASSCFDIVTALHNQKHLSDYAKHKLMYAVALACEVRLRWYMKANKQCDNIDSVSEMIELIGKRSTISYFQIAYALQSDISKRLKLKPGHFYSSLTLLNLSLFLFVKDQENVRKTMYVQMRANPSLRVNDFDQSLKDLEKQISESSLIEPDFDSNSATPENQEIWKKLQKFGEVLHSKGCFDDAIECFQKSTELIQQIKLTPDQVEQKELERHLQINISSNYRKIAWSLNFLDQYEQANLNAKESLELLQSLSPQTDTDINRELAFSFRGYGYSWSKLGQHEEAEQNLIKSLQIFSQISPNIDFDIDVSETMHKLGRCYLHMNKFDEAKKYFERSLQIQERLSPDVLLDRQISVILLDLGRCLMKMNRFEEAKIIIEKSLQIDHLRLTGEFDSNRGGAITLHILGCCLLNMDELDEAHNCLTRSLHITERVSIDVDSDLQVSSTLYQRGCCLVKMEKFEEAKTCLERSLEIKKRLFGDDTDRGGASEARHMIGYCLSKMNKIEEAKSYLDNSSQIKSNK